MKKTIIKSSCILLMGFIPTGVFGQQFPIIEGYNINPFVMSPAFAGIKNPKTVFVDYRADLLGFDGGPTTYQLSYNDKFNGKKKESTTEQSQTVGFGGRFIYDKTDIFSQTLILGTYTYEVRIAKEHKINFGLSAGFYRHTFNYTKYFNNPDYVQDLVLVYGQGSSKLKFASDVSALYRYKQAEAGILFSSVMFGSVRYSNTETSYKPMKYYLVHFSYLYTIDDKWSARPLIILRGGQFTPFQVELAPSVTWKDRFWGTMMFRTGGVLGMGFGGEVFEGLILNYSYNLISNASTHNFGSNQLSLGVKIGRSSKKG